MDTDSNEKTYDINNYGTEDLLGILNLAGEAPVNKDKIDEKLQLLKFKLRNKANKDKIYTFLDNAAEKLKSAFDNFNKQTWQDAYNLDDSDASKVLTSQYQDNNTPGQNLIIDKESNTIGRIKQTLQDKLAIQGTVQGDKNPLQRKTIQEVINIDSFFRQILDPSGTTCTNDEFALANPQMRLYTSTNYVISLARPILNVVNISVAKVEIPYSWHVFSEDYGTNRFTMNIEGDDEQSRDIIIESGNYTTNSLWPQINLALNNLGDDIYGSSNHDWGNINYNQGTSTQGGGLYFTYSPFSNKIKIHNYTGKTIKFNWYIEDSIANQCTSSSRDTPNSLLNAARPGNKINYNFGWLLGFRTLNTTISSSQTAVAVSTLDVYGPRYFLLSLDDFNNNKPNKELISLVDNTSNNFKLPEYYKPQSMNESIYTEHNGKKYQPGFEFEPENECIDVAGPESDRGCAVNDINNDSITNLTKKQKYSVQQMIQANSTSNRKPRYTSPNTSDILLRIPVTRAPTDPNQIIAYRNENLEQTKRVYFGPIKLTKLNVRLLNDKGFEVNLNDRDWSFEIFAERLYQY